MSRIALLVPALALFLCSSCRTPPPPTQAALDEGTASVVVDRVVSGLILIKAAKIGGAAKPDIEEIFAFSALKVCKTAYKELPLPKNSIDAKAPVQFGQLAKQHGSDADSLTSKIAYVLCADSAYTAADATALIRERVERD